VFFLQLFSNYSLALLLFGKRILAQKLLVKCWLDFGGLVLGSSQFLLLPKKVLPNSKVVKIDSKTII